MNNVAYISLAIICCQHCHYSNNRRLHNFIHHTDMTKRLTRQTKLRYTLDFLKNNQLIIASIDLS